MAEEKINVPVEVSREYRKLLTHSRYSVHPIDNSKLRQAFTLITKACRSNQLADNDPLIFQSLHIAHIVISEIGLGTTSTVSALLYGFAEKDFIKVDEIRNIFGARTATMVSDMLKIRQIDTNQSSTQAENFRKLLLTIANDLRVILVKLAERLYVMRNLDKYSRPEQIRISTDTYYLYAPLGHRLGLYKLKSELEDLTMRYLDTEMYHFIQRKLEESAPERNKFIKEFIAPIQQHLEESGTKFEIKGRTKSVTSIFNKMKKQNVEFEEVYDLFAIRIIVDADLKNEKTECWKAFSIVTGMYQPNPLRMRDWISVPKSNGYESLHTTVIGPKGRWVEVQIRTRRMDEIAEKGLAAHWKYKGQKADQGIDDWLNKVREMLETPDPDALNFMDDFRLSLYSKEIFVFTPKGDLRKLPKGATVLDFAFDIHSNVGMACVGAKVNGKSVPIRYVLNNGDRIEITTSKNQKPKEDWLDFVVTSKAITKIKASLKEEKMAEAENGKEVFQRRLRNWKMPYNDVVVNYIIHEYKLKTAIDLYYAIAKEKIDMADIKEKILDFEKQSTETPVANTLIPIKEGATEKLISNKTNNNVGDDVLIIDEKISNIDYKLARCCNPIMGDEIFGFITIFEGIKIHRTNCPNAAQLLSRYGYRIVNARWTRQDSNMNFRAGIKVTGYDDIGIVGKLTDVIAKDLKVSLRGFSVDTDKGVFEGIIKLYVHDTSHLEVLINKLRKVKGVTSAVRIDAS
jgi:GTP pyrophosphokinase